MRPVADDDYAVATATAIPRLNDDSVRFRRLDSCCSSSEDRFSRQVTDPALPASAQHPVPD